MSAARTIDVVGQSANLTIGGPVSGAFALTKGGTGSLKLNSPTGSSHTGGTTVTGALNLDFANLATPTNLLRPPGPPPSTARRSACWARRRAPMPRPKPSAPSS